MTNKPKFVPGLKLCEAFFHEAAQPIIRKAASDNQYSAALIGWGSDVLGYDDEYSMDHMWGPRFLLFLDEEILERQGTEIDTLLRAQLPTTFMGFATHFETSPKGDCLVMCKTVSGPINHMIEFHSLRSFLQGYLGIAGVRSLTSRDWLNMEEHRLRAVTAGVVFHDGLGVLEPMRSSLHFYPDQVWYFLMKSRWREIAEKEAFVGRCGESGDEPGSRLIAARLAETIMRIAFLQERKYAPYSKWFGRAFRDLKCAKALATSLTRVLSAGAWKERDRSLADAYTFIGNAHNALGICAKILVRAAPAYETYRTS